MFCDHDTLYRQLSVTLSGVFVHFLTLLCTNCIPFIRHRDDGHGGDRNMLLKNNNTWMNAFINVHLFGFHIK